MDTAAITQVIGSLGFPIAACIWMAYFINTTIKDFTQAMQNNTLALEKLVSKLDGGE